MRVIDFFDRAVGRFGARPCLVDECNSLSFDEVSVRTHALAAWIRDRVGPGSCRIGVLAPNCVEAMIAILAIFRADGVWIPANGRASAMEVGAFLKLTECDLLLFEPQLSEMAHTVAEIAGCPAVVLPSSVPEPARRAMSAQSFSRDDICSAFGTGGTTGQPKAAMWSHRTWHTLSVNFLTAVRHVGEPVHLVAAPLTHAAGVIAMPLLAIGATTVILDRAEPGLLMDAIERHRVTTLFLPPTVIYSMLAHPDVRARDYSSLQNLIYAAAPMSVRKLKEAWEVFGPVLVQTFGQAEAPMVCTALDQEAHRRAIMSGDDRRLASCGRPTLLTSVAILDESGHVQPPGATGEIAIAGDLLMAGYHGNPEATAACRVGEWQRTGDLGHIDSEGFVAITDRKKDMIISGGFNVYPSEIEQLLWAHPAVRDCAVVGCPDPKWGEAVVAVVELKSGEIIDEATLIAHCKAGLGSIKAPKRIEFWPELPRSPVGKVLKRVVRDHFWSDQDRPI